MIVVVEVVLVVVEMTMVSSELSKQRNCNETTFNTHHLTFISHPHCSDSCWPHAPPGLRRLRHQVTDMGLGHIRCVCNLTRKDERKRTLSDRELANVMCHIKGQ